jgi:hypothetical protein
MLLASAVKSVAVTAMIEFFYQSKQEKRFIITLLVLWYPINLNIKGFRILDSSIILIHNFSLRVLKKAIMLLVSFVCCVLSIFMKFIS